MAILVEQLMKSPPVTTTFSTKLKEIQSIFESKKFHHILVLDDNQNLAGIISDRDVLKNISPFVGTYVQQKIDKDTLDKTARQIMTPNPFVVYPDQTVPEAAKILTEKNVSTLPVLTRSKEVVGILSWKDVLRVVAKAR